MTIEDEIKKKKINAEGFFRGFHMHKGRGFIWIEKPTSYKQSVMELIYIMMQRILKINIQLKLKLFLLILIYSLIEKTHGSLIINMVTAVRLLYVQRWKNLEILEEWVVMMPEIAKWLT